MSNTESSPRQPRFARMARTWGLPLALGTSLAFLWMFYVNPSDGSAVTNQQAPKPAPIDGDRAYGYLKSICAIGPRIAGSPANARQLKLAADHFKAKGATLREQPFSTRHPLSGKKVEMVNLVASFFPDRTERVVLAAHYDTRPFPDREPDPAKRRNPFIGANDGASGVALLMEIANHLTESSTPWGVDLVLLDGEELVYEDDNGNKAGDYFLGSKEFSRRYKAEQRKSSKPRYVAGMVLDMVASKEIQIPVELGSNRLAPSLVREVWGVADKMNSKAFVQNLGTEVLDDHLAMNAAGIPTIDIIDFEYPSWHTANDVPEECSAESLKEVGRVVTAWLAQPKTARSKKR